ncbi:MAG: guanylate kinase [Candidatus Muproteobacteria bacterium RIFCSPHIGHO2_01_FULL_65_16]|uniref:Guanylate kinase n=1 Tax=Candidatus Muproteobacteria bacterium RIFCSPHIGHO2_01_FULL_65_16 TaxID=1817764 RepID=A0A1F6TLT0_9PROT|nr:MAG: guanylate kinase [Candidatus Muproteobacteria bacterium RIFCSPHIGHO2_01_FULL_65_16]
MNKPKLFILSAASGTGKTSLANALVESLPDLEFSVSHTTRAPRPGERHGVHYYFVNRKEFEEMVAAGRFLEHAQVFGNHYGTSRAAIENLLRRGKSVILDIDWQGARAVKALMPEAVSVFILPPTRAALEERLIRRGQDSAEVVARRMREAVAEMRHYTEFDYVVVNDDFAATMKDLTAIIRGRGDEVRPPNLDVAALLRE